MSMFCFVLFRTKGIVREGDESRPVNENTLLISSERLKAYGESVSFFYYTLDALKNISVVLNSLWGKEKKYRDASKQYLKINVQPLDQASQDVINLFTVKDFQAPHSSFLFFCSLFIDWNYFSSFMSLWKSEASILRQLIALIQLHACRPWPVSKYAASLGLSVRKFNVIFYERYGVSAKRWLRERRLKQAADLLSATQLQIADIAEVCGFNNHAYFSSRFKRKYECTPRDWREEKSNLLVKAG